MDLNSVMGHVDFANPVSWIGLWGAILAILPQRKSIRSRPPDPRDQRGSDGTLSKTRARVASDHLLGGSVAANAALAVLPATLYP